MLHILWMILKCILILLGVLLGILIAVILLLLFCPVRYRAELVKDTDDFRSVEGEAQVSWLFHGIALGIRRKAGKMQREIRFFGFPLNLQKKEKKKTKVQKQEEPKEPTSKEQISKEQISKEQISKEQATEEQTTAGQPKKELPSREQPPKKDLPWEEPKTAEEPPKGEAAKPASHKKTGKKVSFKNKIQRFLEKLTGTFRKWSLTIRNIYAKMDWWKEFLSHARIQEAIRLSRKTLWKILKHMFPTKIQGELTFGSEDPSVTGGVLAVLGMTMPFHKNCIEISPLFDGRNVLEGQISLRGRIYGIVFVKAALEIYFNKDIKYAINRWKYKED